jgi:hypothetical protein
VSTVITHLAIWHNAHLGSPVATSNWHTTLSITWQQLNGVTTTTTTTTTTTIVIIILPHRLTCLSSSDYQVPKHLATPPVGL